MQINGNTCPTKPSNINVINEPVDAIDIFRQKSDSGFKNEEPLFICNISDVIRKHLVWKKLMPRVIPFYATKCNDDPVLLETLIALGAGFDCASKGEITKVMSLGAGPQSIVYAQTSKPISHLEFAAKVNVDLMTVDSGNELQKISQHYPTARLLLRMRYDAKNAQHPLGRKFGCDPCTEAPELIKLSKSLGMNMVGISFHVGSNCMEPSIFAEALEAARKLFDFAESVGYHFNLVDIGGGFPGRNNTNITEHASIVNRSIELYFPSPDVKFISEPGRYYATSAFSLACRVQSIREVRENGQLSSIMYFINDGIFGSFADNLCTKVFHPDLKVVHPLTLKSANEELFMSTVWGPTCNCADVVCEDVLLPRLDINDLVLFENMGAYSLVTATTFNGYPLPKVEYYIERKDWDRLQEIKKNKEPILMRGS